MHDAGYLARLEAFCAGGGGNVDPDTYTRANFMDREQRAAGAGVDCPK